VNGIYYLVEFFHCYLLSQLKNVFYRFSVSDKILILNINIYELNVFHLILPNLI
jgi:hypothetical protein